MHEFEGLSVGYNKHRLMPQSGNVQKGSELLPAGSSMHARRTGLAT